MAKITLNGIDEITKKLSNLERGATNIAKKAVIAGAKPVADEIRKQLESKLSGSKYSKGQLESSLGIADADIDEKGVVNTSVGFTGYDKNSRPSNNYPNGKPNAIKIRAMESGTSKQKKTPVIRPAIKNSKNNSINEMKKVVEEELKKAIK